MGRAGEPVNRFGSDRRRLDHRGHPAALADGRYVVVLGTEYLLQVRELGESPTGRLGVAERGLVESEVQRAGERVRMDRPSSSVSRPSVRHELAGRFGVVELGQRGGQVRGAHQPVVVARATCAPGPSPPRATGSGLPRLVLHQAGHCQVDIADVHEGVVGRPHLCVSATVRSRRRHPCRRRRTDSERAGQAQRVAVVDAGGEGLRALPATRSRYRS